MSVYKNNARPAPKQYQGKKHTRWRMRVTAVALSVAGALGLWQFVAHEPPISTHSAPSFQDAEQQLQLNNRNDASQSGFFSSQGAPSAPNTISGVS
jgi:hypothetical protein